MDLKQKVRFWYGIFLSVFTVVVGILFISTMARVYFSAAGGANEAYGMYSREVIKVQFLPCFIVLLCYIAAAAVGFVFSILLPLAPKKKRKTSDYAVFLRLRKKTPMGEGEEFSSERKAISKAEKIRLFVWLFCAAVCLATAIIAIVYLSDASHFAGVAFNSEIFSMVKNIFPWVLLSFLVCVGALIFEASMGKRELPRMKKLIALGKGAPIEKPTKLAAFGEKTSAFFENETAVVSIRLAVLVVGVVFVCVGIFNGGIHDVLMKAIKICTECIGLG